MKNFYVYLTLLFIIFFSIITATRVTSKKIVPGIISPNAVELKKSPAKTSQTTDSYIPTLPTIESIFTKDHRWTEQLDRNHLITMLATGDIIPARAVNLQTIKENDFTWSFKHTFSVVKNADLTFANLEAPLIPNCPVTNEGMRFCGDVRHLQGLILAGIDVVNLANNHTGNYGLAGIEKTTELLKEADIEVTGRNNVIVKEIKGTKFAFLGYNHIGSPEQGIAWASKDIIKTEVAHAKKKADFVIVTFHYGTEYVAQPNPDQIDLSHYAIDSGADLIIGNHPHWIQPVEIYKNKLITYAHGNYIFDQMWSQKTREGVLGKYTFYDNKLIDVEFYPLQIDNYGQPRFLEGENRIRILNEMKSQSEKLAIFSR